jgi:hypothetical protein
MLSKLSSHILNKKNIFAFTAILGLCSSNFMFINSASAQVSAETQQVIDDTNAALGVANEWIQRTERQRQQEMNALYSACNNGNSNACLEYRIRLNAENRGIDNYIQRLRNRSECGSPVCY